MKYKKGLIFICLIICMFSIASVCAGDANDTVVASEDQSGGVISVENEEIVSADDVDDGVDIHNGEIISLEEKTGDVLSIKEDEKLNVDNCSEVLHNTYYPTDFTDLESKVSSAYNGDTIVLNGYYSFSSQITVDKQLNFIGINDAKLDGRNANRLFKVNVDDVTFKNITFQNGHVDNDDGGALYTHFRMFIDNCKFINNYAGWSCGAIFIGSGSDYYISNSYFEGNSGEYGGALSIRNVNSNTKGNIYNCTFYRNVGRYTYGAVECANVEKCTFIENRAENGDAGAVGVYEHDFIIKDCTFINNTSTRHSGALHLGGPENIHHNVINCHFEGNSARFSGDICCDYSDVKILNCSFSNSHGSNGGSIHLGYKNSTIAAYDVIIGNCSFENCLATKYGGAIDAYKSDNLKILNCSFLNCSAIENKGGAIATDSCNNINILSCSFNSCNAGGSGAVRLDASDNINITNSTFTNNHAANGGAIGFAHTTAEYKYSSNIIIDNCSFENNSATSFGGAIYGVCVTNLNILNSNLISNSAGMDGGAIYVSGDFCNSVLWADFKDNRANNSGGAVYISGSISSAVFCGDYNDNQANDCGGAIYAKNIASSTLNGNFKDSSAGLGGALYCNISDSTFNGDFEDNYADYGGAVFGNITDSIFNGDFTGNGAGAGGAIYGNVADSIFNGDFIYNTATNVASQMSEQATGDVLGSTENDKLSFMPAMTVGGGVLYGNVASSTFNSNFVANMAHIGAVIAGNVEKSVFTGKFSKNTADSGIIVSGNALKSVFSVSGEDIIEFEGKLFGDLLDSHIKDQNMNKEDKERLENLSEYFVDIEADLNIYVDGNANSNDNIAVTYHLNLLNLVLDKTVDLGLSKLKKVANPLEGPLGIVADNLLDGALGRITEKVTGDRLKGYLTYEIRNVHNLKDAIDIANNLGLLYKNKFTRLNIKFSLDDLSVKIAPGVYRGDKNKGLEITTNYTLMKDGEGDVIIDAENNGNIITAKWPEITIDGLTFMHASDSAIIFEKGLYDSVINANFIDNKNEFYGGAIYSLGDIKRCVFNGAFRHNSADALSNNYLNGFGGAIRVNGNIADCIFNADFINNTAGTWGYSMGGAIDAVNILNSIFAGKFIDNSAGYIGGAICGNLLNCNLSGDFINNYARSDGGAIEGNLLNCIFSGYFANNVAYVGGAVFSKYIKNSIFNGVFVNNTALGDANWGGGAIAAYDNITNSIFSGNFINNSAEQRGGAIFSKKILDSTFNGTFKGNVINSEFGKEYSYGGAIYGSQIDHCIFYGKYIDNKATYGGAVFVQTIDYCTFNAYYNGNIAIYGNVLWTFWFYSCAEVDVTLHNSANIPDSDIYASSYESYKKSLEDRYSSSGEDDLLGTSLNEIYVDGSTLYNGDGNINNPYNNLKSAINNANDRDTIYIAPGTYSGENNIGLTINKALNLIKKGNGEVVFDGENTGRIFTINNDSFNITGLTFTHATDSAIVFNNGLFNSKIEANFYDNKKANGDGAALNIHGYVFNCVFNGDYIGNSAANGGAVCADEIISSKFNGVFTNNTANNGGAIKAAFIDSIINADFTNNTANVNGGAIIGNVASSLINGNFKNNKAANGGAIYANISSSSITGDFKGNGAANGGSIYGRISSSNFTGDFNDNGAVNGGAIYGSISNSNFKSNFLKNSADKGSVVYGNGDISKSLFKGSFKDNSAVAGEGKLFYVEGSISNSNFIGDIFANSSNINALVYSLRGMVVNCVFSNAGTNDPDNAHQSQTNTTGDKDIIIDVADVKIVMKQASVLYTGKYSVTVQGKNGKTAGGISVLFKINGKTVKTAKSNSKGVATFKVPSKYVPKTYTIKAIVFAMSASKKVTVKQILKIKTVKVKKSAGKLVLTASLKKVDGKYLKGKKITFKFNGKKYKATTNAKGIAKATIKKAVLKKLKVGKKVKYQASYSKITVKKSSKVKK